jgi:hypothetical protein
MIPFTVMDVADDVSLQPPEVTNLRYHVLLVKAPGV